MPSNWIRHVSYELALGQRVGQVITQKCCEVIFHVEKKHQCFISHICG